jgi:hypothetical protein
VINFTANHLGDVIQPYGLVYAPQYSCLSLVFPILSYLFMIILRLQPCHMHALREPGSRLLSSEEELSGARLKKKLRQTIGNGPSSRNKTRQDGQSSSSPSCSSMCLLGRHGWLEMSLQNQPDPKSNGRSKFPGIVFRGMISLRSA